MKVIVQTKISTKEYRELIVNLASEIVESTGQKKAYKYDEGIPYKPNEWDDSFWTIDAGNDWKIKFHDEHSFEVIHRYQINDKTRTEYSSVNEGVKGLANLLAYKLNGKVIVE